MPPTTRSTLELYVVLPAAIATLAAAAPASSADQGSVQIIAIAPAFCRVAAMPAARACNTVNDAQVTVQVSNLDGAALQLDGANIAVSAHGAATLSAGQLAGLSGLRVVDARPADLRGPVAVELTITPQ
jgi:hypothetical protein